MHQLCRGCPSPLLHPPEQVMNELKNNLSATNLWSWVLAAAECHHLGRIPSLCPRIGFLAKLLVGWSILSLKLWIWSVNKCFPTFSRILLQGWRNFWKRKTMTRSSRAEVTTRTGITQERVRRRLAAASSSGNTCPIFICSECLCVTFEAAKNKYCM